MTYSLDDLKRKNKLLSMKSEEGVSKNTSTLFSTINKDLRSNLGLDTSTSLDKRIDKMSKAVLPTSSVIYNKSKVNLICFFDRSASCRGTENATMLGYNNLIKNERETGLPTNVTTILFNGISNVIEEDADIEKVKPLSYYANGGTALYDTLTVHLNRIKSNRVLKGNEREKTIVIIMTDGKDEHSKNFEEKDVRKIISECQSLGWEFIFLGASENLKLIAQSFGINPDNIEKFIPDANGYYLNFEAVKKALNSYRKEGKVKPDWANIIRQNNIKALGNGKNEEGPTLRLGGRR